jgi:hypothetical protein
VESRTEKHSTSSEEKPKSSLVELLGRRRAEIERQRSDVSWKMGLVTQHLSARVARCEISTDEAAERLVTARQGVRPELRRMGLAWEGEDLTEVRAFALLDYIEECLVLMGDRFVPEETRREARDAIDRLWGRETSLGADIERRGLFALAFERAADAMRSPTDNPILRELRSSPSSLVAMHLYPYDRDLALRVAALPVERVANLLEQVADEGPGVRKRGAARKWPLLSELWAELTGERRAPNDLQQDFNRTKLALGEPRRDKTPRKRKSSPKKKRTSRIK